jgi:hypothetical protein
MCVLAAMPTCTGCKLSLQLRSWRGSQSRLRCVVTWRSSSSAIHAASPAPFVLGRHRGGAADHQAGGQQCGNSAAFGERDNGHGHHHGPSHPDPDWGPVRKAVWTSLDKSGLLKAGHAASHSLSISIASAVCLAASAALLFGLPHISLQLPLASPAAALAAALYATTLALSGTSAVVEALLQACTFSVRARA